MPPLQFCSQREPQVGIMDCLLTHEKTCPDLAGRSLNVQFWRTILKNRENQLRGVPQLLQKAASGAICAPQFLQNAEAATG